MKFFEDFEPLEQWPLNTIMGFLLGIQMREEVEEPTFYTAPNLLMPGVFYFVFIPKDAELLPVRYSVDSQYFREMSTMINMFVKYRERVWSISILFQQSPLGPTALQSTAEINLVQ